MYLKMKDLVNFKGLSFSVSLQYCCFSILHIPEYYFRSDLPVVLFLCSTTFSALESNEPSFVVLLGPEELAKQQTGDGERMVLDSQNSVKGALNSGKFYWQ